MTTSKKEKGVDRTPRQSKGKNNSYQQATITNEQATRPTTPTTSGAPKQRATAAPRPTARQEQKDK
jgi:hypothetical protein